jgi:hypothetical protein
MNAPFFKYGLFGAETNLVMALVIGIGFGFFLERAGFGSGMKLAAQFYFRDLAVFKVMFTAIVTAMLGVFWLSYFGLLDLSLVTPPPTYVIPQLVGGLIFGVGFVMGGYCPGTSCVATITGKRDGLVHIAGMIGGIVLFGELFPFFESFYTLTPLPQANLSDVLSIPYGTLVLIVTLAALAAFVGAEKIESRLRAD